MEARHSAGTQSLESIQRVMREQFGPHTANLCSRVYCNGQRMQGFGRTQNSDH